MIKQYPHYLFAISGGDAVQNSTGGWDTNEDPKTDFISMCREETNGRGNELQVGGGLFYRYSSLVQLPRTCPIVDEGTTVFVSDLEDGTKVRIKGQVLKFDKGQLHCRLWIN
jgi:hypothetical protein